MDTNWLHAGFGGMIDSVVWLVDCVVGGTTTTGSHDPQGRVRLNARPAVNGQRPKRPIFFLIPSIISIKPLLSLNHLNPATAVGNPHQNVDPTRVVVVIVPTTEEED